ncbi:MAG: hypothetical protein LWW92_11965, partial [Rhodocyclales bacterium]|nr:hypothetical protein [Rhodocyclales bacterium]
IASNNNLSAPLYNGLWYKTTVVDPAVYYTNDTNGSLAINLGGDLATARALPGGKIVAGTLPLLDASKAFYVEFQVGLSYSNNYSSAENNADHWPAVWLMPAEHNSTQDDHLASDPDKYERWMELDVDEGGFWKHAYTAAEVDGLVAQDKVAGDKIHGALINWSGIWAPLGQPSYNKVQNSNHTPRLMNKNDGTTMEWLDRSRSHTFGLSYDPNARKVTWWLDGVAQMSAGGDLIPPIAYTHHYYLILSAQSHEKLPNGQSRTPIPYKMHVHGIRAFVRP